MGVFEQIQDELRQGRSPDEVLALLKAKGLSEANARKFLERAQASVASGSPRSSPVAELPTPTAVPGGGTAGPSYAWVGKVLMLVAVVAVYFGSRGCNRYLASREARSAALEALAGVMAPADARAIVEKHHPACFDEYYRTGWGRRDKSNFDAEKYAQCMVRRAESDLNRSRAAQAPAPRRRPPVAVPTRPPAPTPAMAPAAPATAAPSLGLIVIGDAKLLAFAREPQLTVRVGFMAVGGAATMRQAAMCSYAVECSGQAQGVPTGQRMTASCPLKISGAKGSGELHFALANPAPAQGTCSLDLALTDGTQLRSNTIVVPLS